MTSPAGEETDLYYAAGGGGPGFNPFKTKLPIKIKPPKTKPSGSPTFLKILSLLFGLFSSKVDAESVLDDLARVPGADWTVRPESLGYSSERLQAVRVWLKRRSNDGNAGCCARPSHL